MKKLILSAIMVLGLNACFFDSNSDSEQVITKSRLTVNTDASLKRITLEGPSNKIVNREVKTDSTYGEYEEVLVEWGEVQAEDYDMKYYLFSTDSNPIRIDSIVFDDPMTFVNKKYEGSVITKSMNLTGDNELPVKFINSATTVIDRNTGEILEDGLGSPNKNKMIRDRYMPWDSNITMTVYGADTVNKNLTKLVIKFHAKQSVVNRITHWNSYDDATGIFSVDSMLNNGTLIEIPDSSSLYINYAYKNVYGSWYYVSPSHVYVYEKKFNAYNIGLSRLTKISSDSTNLLKYLSWLN